MHGHGMLFDRHRHGGRDLLLMHSTNSSKDSGAHDISQFTRTSWLTSVLQPYLWGDGIIGLGLSSSAHISDWKFALFTVGMRVSCGWQPFFDYLFCCKQRPSKFRKTGTFKYVKATSCSSDSASKYFPVRQWTPGNATLLSSLGEL